MLSTSPMNNVPGWHHFNSILLTINIIQTPTKSHNLLCNILSQITFSNVHIHTQLHCAYPIENLMANWCEIWCVINLLYSMLPGRWTYRRTKALYLNFAALADNAPHIVSPVDSLVSTPANITQPTQVTAYTILPLRSFLTNQITFILWYVKLPALNF